VVTYSGAPGGVPGIEKIYVDGVLNNQEKKVLALHNEADGYPVQMNLGTAFENPGLRMPVSAIRALWGACVSTRGS
jgi:hypothetical protein